MQRTVGKNAILKIENEENAYLLLQQIEIMALKSQTREKLY